MTEEEEIEEIADYIYQKANARRSTSEAMAVAIRDKVLQQHVLRSLEKQAGRAHLRRKLSNAIAELCAFVGGEMEMNGVSVELLPVGLNPGDVFEDGFERGWYAIAIGKNDGGGVFRLPGSAPYLSHGSTALRAVKNLRHLWEAMSLSRQLAPNRRSRLKKND